MLNNYSLMRHAQAIETQTRYQRVAATERLLRRLRRPAPTVGQDIDSAPTR